MNRKRTHGNPEVMVPLTDDDLQRFHRCAPAALDRRGGRFVADELGTALRLFVMGLTPIVGMMQFGWSASQLLCFLLVGAWVSILCDIAKFALLRKAAETFAQSRYDNWHVWVVADALRKGREELPKTQLRAKYRPGAGVLVDVLLGSVSTVVICMSLGKADSGLGMGLLEDRGVLYSLAGLVGYQVLFTAWEIVDHKIGSGKDRGVKIAVGLRGVGLLFLMLLVLVVGNAVGENGPVARAVMLAVNGLVVLFGLFSVAGLWMMRGETAWLRDYLSRRG
ncbi:MAG: hypothetical protein HQ581_08565 [Planctomycetes bacterium]|nr:hypothetical protein [Planctomycetota bacterium]